MSPNSRPKFSDFYTLHQTKLLEKHITFTGVHTSVCLHGIMGCERIFFFSFPLFWQTTAIDVAAYFGNARIVRVLLNRGASVTNKCVFGQGCLDCAIKGSRPSETSLEILKHKRWEHWSFISSYCYNFHSFIHSFIHSFCQIPLTVY